MPYIHLVIFKGLHTDRDKSQSPTYKIIEQQSRLLSGQMNLESSRQANVNTQWKMSEPSRVTSTTMPQHVVNHHSVVLDAENPGISQSNFVNAAISNPTLIGQELKRVSVPIFSGDKNTYQNWKAGFTACVDQAPATAEYKLL